MKYLFLVCAAFIFYKPVNAQNTDAADMESKVNVPVYYVDSVLTNQADMVKVNAADIATLIHMNSKNAEAKIGSKGKNGIIFIETKSFARKRYWRFFSSKSGDYLKIVPKPGEDKLVQYVLNGRVLTSDFEGELSAITNITFKDLQVVQRDYLLKNYGIYGKKYGVVITTDSTKF